MKIGVITFWWCYENYGQILQIYAYQRYLKKLGHKGFLIRYMASSHFSTSIGEFLLRIIKNPKAFFNGLLNRFRGVTKARMQRRIKITPLRDFEGFRNKYLQMTPKVYRNYKELAEDEIEADAYSVGSDVVWGNFPFSDDGRPMFLDFGNESAKRFAYSASFGADNVNDAYRKFASPLLRKLDAIGVREHTGVGICDSMGRSDAVHVIDPVLLLSKLDYLEEFGIKESLRSGVFGYYLNSSNPFPLEEINQVFFGEDAKIEIATVYADMGLPENLLVNPTIQDWIRKIAFAQLFVTNSFHGASMAIVMHTPFVVMLKHNGKGMDSRLISLLEKFGLQNRIYNGQRSFADIVADDINWENVDSILEYERQIARDFLRKVGV